MKRSIKQKLDILLVLCPSWSIEMPHLGLAYLTSFLHSKGMDVEVLDLNIKFYNRVNKELKPLWDPQNHLIWTDEVAFAKTKDVLAKEIKDSVREILSFDSQIIGFSTYRSNLRFSSEVAKEIKKGDNKKIIIFGGPGIDLFAERNWVPPGVIDAFVVGEGEEVAYEIINCVRDNKFGQFPISGVLFTNTDIQLDKIRRKPISDLDDLPILTYDDFDLGSYKILDNQTIMLSLLLSRGCICKCTFCNDHHLWKPFRIRSARSVFKEINHHASKYGCHNFRFNDLLINGNLKQLEELCNLIIDSGIKINWDAQAIARKDMDYELLCKMKEAGCRSIVYGIESGSDKILSKMGKNKYLLEPDKILKLTHQAGIETGVNIIVGFPGETDEDFQKTIDFLKRNQKYIDVLSNIHPCFITPLSALELRPEEFGLILPKPNHAIYWQDSTGNNYELRKRRLKQLILELDGTDIRFDKTRLNLYDEALEEQVNVLENLDLSKFNNKINPFNIYRRPHSEFDILLISAPPWGIDNPPLGVAYLSSYLKHKCFKVGTFDTNIFIYKRIHSNLRALWEIENASYWGNTYTFQIIKELLNRQIHTCVERIIKSGAKLVGFSVVNPGELFVIEIIKRIRRKDKNIKIIIGGPACSTENSRKIFYESLGGLIDAYVVGEGEIVLTELIRRFNGGYNIDGMSGVIASSSAEKKDFQLRAPIRNLDELVFPTFEEFRLSDYGGKYLALLWSRGCVGNCCFCKEKANWGEFRYRSADHVFSEIQYHLQHNGRNTFAIYDSVINGRLDELEKICDLINAAGYRIWWSAEAIPRNMDFDLLRKMKGAGCHTLIYGVESGADEILRRMRKSFTVETAEETLRLTHNANIKTAINIIVGFPGEDNDEFTKTLDFIKRNHIYIDKIDAISTLQIVDGTELFNQPERYGIILPSEDFHNQWFTSDGNTLEERKRRVERIIALAKSLGIELGRSFQNDGREKRLQELSKEFVSTKAINKAFKKEINALYSLRNESFQRREEDFQMDEKDKEIVRLRKQLKEKEDELQRIFSSHVWKIVRILHKIKRFLGLIK